MNVISHFIHYNGTYTVTFQILSFLYHSIVHHSYTLYEVLTFIRFWLQGNSPVASHISSHPRSSLSRFLLSVSCFIIWQYISSRNMSCKVQHNICYDFIPSIMFPNNISHQCTLLAYKTLTESNTRKENCKELTPWNRVLIEKLIVSNCSLLSWIQRFTTTLRTDHYWISSSAQWIQSSPSHTN
jgi:hypothetical protein